MHEREMAQIEKILHRPQSRHGHPDRAGARRQPIGLEAFGEIDDGARGPAQTDPDEAISQSHAADVAPGPARGDLAARVPLEQHLDTEQHGFEATEFDETRDLGHDVPIVPEYGFNFRIVGHGVSYRTFHHNNARPVPQSSVRRTPARLPCPRLHMLGAYN